MKESDAPDPAFATSVTLADVQWAAERLRGVARRTPVMTSKWLDDVTGATVFLKCENFQRVGAFKFRGAYNALSRLPGDSPGVLTYSSGNHAQAVALAAALRGLRAVIVMPSDAPAVKLAATRAYLARARAGSAVVEYDRLTQSREKIGAELAACEGLTIVPPYDHPHVIAGQGTAALELLDETGPLDIVVTPCGGGGLLSGSAIAAKGLAPGCRVIGVEPEAGDDATRSFRTGRLHAVTNPDTIADGARTPSLGKHTFALVMRHVDEMMTVSDGELIDALGGVMERMKIVAEPTGVLGLAGVLRTARERPECVRGRRIGIVISGGNVDVRELGRLMAGARQ